MKDSHTFMELHMLRFERAFGRTKEEMRLNLYEQSSLPQEGPVTLIWVNTEDLNNFGEWNGQLDIQKDDKNGEEHF